MCDMCGDGRFEIIEAYKRKLIEATNIETSPEEMAVIDNILFRFWQMGWLSAAQPESEERMGKSEQNVLKEDLISRKAAIDALYHVDEYNGRSIEAIRNLPSAQPERKKGRWMMYHTRGLRCICSECHSRFTTPYCYCPHCGSFNREGEMEVDG